MRVEQPGPVDVLASLYRSALAERSVELLEFSGAELGLIGPRCEIAREGDGGPRPNPLWARWIAATRPLQLERVGGRLAALASTSRPPEDGGSEP